MLNSTSTFLNKLRRDKIRAPTVRNFSEDGWRQDYATLATGTSEERAVFDAGLWMAPKLRALWEQVDALNLTRFHFDSLVTVLMLLSVREYHRHIGPQPQGRPASMTADYGNTALGDALWRALTFLAAMKDAFRGEEGPDAVAAAAFLQLCASVYVLEYMMGRVIHCGWQLVHCPEGPMFRPSPEAVRFADNEAIALAARSEEYVEFYLVNRHAWDQGGLRGEAPFQIRLTNRTTTRAKFRILDRPPAEMPHTIALFDMDIPFWLRPMMETEPIGLAGLSVAQLVRGWLLLHTTFELIYNRDTCDGTADYATASLHEEDLLEAFRMHGYPRNLAKTVVDFFTYDWKRHEALWAAPLVRVGNLYYPFLPSLMEPNMTRTLDLWLQRCEYATNNGKIDTLLGLRGSVFEQHVRATLGEYFHRNADWNARICPDAVEINGTEIDLLWRIGTTIFIGEAKFMKYPANPNEIGHYYRELGHGAQQASDRVALLAANRARVAQLLQWRGNLDELSFQPLVVCGHAMGGGLSFAGVPCLQFDMLEMFFREQNFVMSGSIEGSRDIALPLPKSPDLAALTRFYLEHPPAIWFRQFAIKTVPVTCCKLAETEVSFEHRAVNLPHTIAREPYCRDRLAQWETMLGNLGGVNASSH